MIFYLAVAARLVSCLIDRRLVLRRAVFVDVVGVKYTTQCVSVVPRGGSLEKLLCSQYILLCKVSDRDGLGSDM